MITEVVLKNFIVLPETVQFKLQSSICQIFALNGKGKSFLLSLLLPRARGDSESYPIVEGKVGYKKLVYEIVHSKYNKLQITIQIEYQPNRKGTHSAKGYITVYKYDTGVAEELNPEGNLNSFEELVKEYLKYDQSTEIISHINKKSCGIITSSPSERLELFKILIKDQIDIVKKNFEKVSNIHRYNENILRRFNEDIRNLPTLEKLKEDFNKANIRIEEESKRIRNIIQETTLLNSKLREVQSKKDNLYLKINIINNIINNIDETTTFADKVFAYKNYKKDIDSTIKELSEIEVSLSEYKNADFSNNVSDKIKNIRKNIEEFNDVNNLINIDTDTVKKNLENLKGIFLFDDQLFSDGVIYNMINTRPEYNTLKSIREVLLKKFKNQESEIASLEKELINIGGNITPLKDYQIDIKDNCNKCPLFSRYQKLKSHNKKILEINEKVLDLRDKLSKSEDTIGILNRLIPIEEKHNIILSSFPEIMKNDSRFKGLFLSLDNKLSNRLLIDEYINTASNIIDRVELLKNLQKDYKLLLEDGSRFKDKNINTFMSLQNKYNAIKEKIQNLKNLEDMYKINLSDEKINYIMENSGGFQYKKKNELKSILVEYDLYDKDIKMYTSQIELLTKEEKETEENITKWRDSLNSIQYKIIQSENLSNQIKSLTQSVSETSAIRVALDKFIPVELLSGVSKSIETVTNQIFDQLDIDFNIRIRAEGKEIKIELIRTPGRVSDSKFFSDGESCVISIIINAAIKSFLDYPIMKVDELDAALDYDLKKKFKSIIYYILNMPNISQLFLVSHRTVLNEPHDIIVIGEYKFQNDMSHCNIIKI